MYIQSGKVGHNTLCYKPCIAFTVFTPWITGSLSYFDFMVIKRPLWSGCYIVLLTQTLHFAEKSILVRKTYRTGGNKDVLLYLYLVYCIMSVLGMFVFYQSQQFLQNVRLQIQFFWQLCHLEGTTFMFGCFSVRRKSSWEKFKCGYLPSEMEIIIIIRTTSIHFEYK